MAKYFIPGADGDEEPDTLRGNDYRCTLCGSLVARITAGGSIFGIGDDRPDCEGCADFEKLVDYKLHNTWIFDKLKDRRKGYPPQDEALAELKEVSLALSNFLNELEMVIEDKEPTVGEDEPVAEAPGTQRAIDEADSPKKRRRRSTRSGDAGQAGSPKRHRASRRRDSTTGSHAGSSNAPTSLRSCMKGTRPSSNFGKVVKKRIEVGESVIEIATETTIQHRKPEEYRSDAYFRRLTPEFYHPGAHAPSLGSTHLDTSDYHRNWQQWEDYHSGKLDKYAMVPGDRPGYKPWGKTRAERKGTSTSKDEDRKDSLIDPATAGVSSQRDSGSIASRTRRGTGRAASKAQKPATMTLSEADPSLEDPKADSPTWPSVKKKRKEKKRAASETQRSVEVEDIAGDLPPGYQQSERSWEDQLSGPPSSSKKGKSGTAFYFQDTATAAELFKDYSRMFRGDVLAQDEGEEPQTNDDPEEPQAEGSTWGAPLTRQGKRRATARVQDTATAADIGGDAPADVQEEAPQADDPTQLSAKKRGKMRADVEVTVTEVEEDSPPQDDDEDEDDYVISPPRDDDDDEVDYVIRT